MPDDEKKHYVPNVNLDFCNIDVFLEKWEELLIQKEFLNFGGKSIMGDKLFRTETFIL